MPYQQYLRSELGSGSPADLIIRSPVIGWIFVIAAAVSLVSALLMVPSVVARPTDVGIGLTVACIVYALICSWCWWERRLARRSVLAIGLFAWATMTFIGGAAVPQRAGVNTVGFIVMPVFLFMITVLGQRRLSMVTLAYAAVVLLGVTGHHLLQQPDATVRAQALSNLGVAFGVCLAFSALGDQIARIVSQQVARAQAVARDYRILFERLPVGAFLRVDRTIIECNETAGLLFGATKERPLKGLDVMTLIPESERAQVHTRMAKAKRLPAGEQLPLRDLEMLNLQGHRVPVTVTSVALDPQRDLTLVLFIDRRRQAQAQHELQKTQRLVQALFKVSAHTMVVTDRETGEFLLVNPAYARAAGREPEEIIGRTVTELGLITPKERAAMLADLPDAGSATGVRLPITDAEGRVHILRQSIVTADFDGRRVLVGVGRDVAEEEQRERELQVILQSAPAAVYVVRHGVVTAASAHYERLLGLAPGTGTGRPYDLDIGGAENMARIARLYHHRLLTGMIVTFEHEVFRADGSTFPGLFTGRMLKPGEQDGFGMVWVIEDITQRREREAQLARAKADAEAASRAKSDFLATMSHEIRTPLNGILGLIELVGDPKMDETTRSQYLELMTESAHSLQEIVSDVIDVSRIETGHLQLQMKDFDLLAWLSSVRASFAALVEAKGLMLDVQASAPECAWVHGDPVRLRQILSNYISNALKFTLHGRITVRLKRLDHLRVRLEVSDTGLGIEPQMMSRLFQPYSQAGSPRDGVRSSGLGLSICRHLAERMGGTTGARSELGAGSTFWAEVDLPALQAPATPAGGILPEITLKGLHLLVVDDNRINLVVARRLLERAGAQVETADGGQQALEAIDSAQARGQAYDLVVMDVQMPGMNGLEALAALRTRVHAQTLPVLAASAAVTTEEVDLTRAAGFDGFLSKPLELSTLVQAVASAVAKARAPNRHGAIRF